MRPVFSKVAILVAILLLLVGSSCSATPVQQTTTPAQTTSQPSATSATKSPQATPATPATTTSGTLTVDFINVGQGDSILIIAPGGKAMLIDGGEADSGIVQYLKSKGVNHLDMLVATHPHADHIGGLVQVLKALPVAKVVTNGQPTTTKTYENFLDAIAAAKAGYVEVERGDSLRLGDLVFAVLNPVTNTGDDLNNNSLVLRLAYGEVSFLFMGDAETAAERSMMVSSFSPVQATILKVGHHGSRSSSSPPFLALVKPEVAIYSAGKGNSYGHPHAETIAALSAVGAKIYGTDVNGTVVVTSDGDSYKVSPVTGQPRGPPGMQPTSTPTSAQTSTPPPAPASPSGALSLEVISVTSPVAPGSNATLAAKTAPGASCTITVYYKSGPSTAQGLSSKKADANGNVSWTWQVGTRTTPGEWSIVVKATKEGQTVSRNTAFKVGG